MLARRDLLASDEERDAVATSLRAHYGSGRLTHGELDARVELTYRSRWRSELFALTRDLPPLPRPPAPPVRRSRLPRLALGLAAVLTAVFFVSVLADLPDELSILLMLFVVPMIVLTVLIVLPVLALLGAIRWTVERLQLAAPRRQFRV